MPSKNQMVRLRQRATQAEELARERSEELARQKEEIARLRQQLKSSSSTTPPGKGTPAQRTSASRPRWETLSSQQEAILEHNEEEERDDEQKGESPDGGLDEGHDEGHDEEESDDDRAADNGGEKSDGDHDMHIMRQLLEGLGRSGSLLLSERR